jgi:hypothetical protein
MQRNQVRVEENELMQTEQKPAKVSATHFCLTNTALRAYPRPHTQCCVRSSEKGILR